MKTEELRTVYTNQESFYKKAWVKEDDDGTQYLYSYYSLIITNFGKVLIFEKDINLYSLTTMKHVREYLRQIGRGDLADLTKAKLLKKLEETDYIIVDILIEEVYKIMEEIEKLKK